MKRVIVYIDGFNLYYGLRSKGWKWLYWLNVQEMARRLLQPEQTLVKTKYFTSIINRPPDKQQRQADYLEAVGTLSNCQIYFGHYLSDTVVCRNCGHSYKAFHEKMTDVNIAVELMTDVFQNTLDVALLVSADSDLVGPVQAVQRLSNKKRVVVAFPPGRSSKALKQTANAYFTIGRSVLAKSVFPDQVIKPDGFVLNRPLNWR